MKWESTHLATSAILESVGISRGTYQYFDNEKKLTPNKSQPYKDSLLTVLTHRLVENFIAVPIYRVITQSHHRTITISISMYTLRQAAERY